MSQKEILRAMMTQLDEAAGEIPEGFYLQFCDYLKELHKHIEPVCQPVVQNVPFTPRVPVDENANAQQIQEALSELIEEMSHPRQRRQRRCSMCREVGHDYRRCPNWVGPRTHLTQTRIA